jgi:hypothetical protein
MYHRQRFPIVVNMGNGLGQSLFLRVTQEDWPTLPGNNFPLWLTWGMVRFGGWCRTVISLGNGPNSHYLGQIQSFLRADSFSLGCTLFSAGGMAQGGEWSRFNNRGQTFLRADSFSPGYTLSSVGGMAQGGEWSRLRNQDNYSSLLEKNSPDSSSLMFYLLRADALPRSHRCE